MKRLQKCRFTARRKTAKKFVICGRGARHWADTCRSGRPGRWGSRAGTRNGSTSTVFLAMRRNMLHVRSVGKLRRPTVRDGEATFGTESQVRDLGIYSSV